MKTKEYMCSEKNLNLKSFKDLMKSLKVIPIIRALINSGVGEAADPYLWTLIIHGAKSIRKNLPKLPESITKVKDFSRRTSEAKKKFDNII